MAARRSALLRERYRQVSTRDWLGTGDFGAGRSFPAWCLAGSHAGAHPSRTCRSMKRILMTSDAAGGVWTYTIELVSELAARGFEVTVAVMGPAPSAGQIADFAGIGR